MLPIDHSYLLLGQHSEEAVGPFAYLIAKRLQLLNIHRSPSGASSVLLHLDPRKDYSGIDSDRHRCTSSPFPRGR
jgi:hypothetical protein